MKIHRMTHKYLSAFSSSCFHCEVKMQFQFFWQNCWFVPFFLLSASSAVTVTVAVTSVRGWRCACWPCFVLVFFVHMVESSAYNRQ